MRVLAIFWRLFVGLATGAVILAMFHVANSPFQKIVVSALVLIYLSVGSSFLRLGYVLGKSWDLALARHIAIAKSLGLNTEIEEEAQKENETSNQRGQVPFWISVFFDTVFALAAILNLILAVV